MIEMAENLIQLLVLIFCFGMTCYQFTRRSSKVWLLLSLYYLTMLMGQLYWVLMLVLLHRSAMLDYVSESTWFAAYLFLFLLARHLLPEGAVPTRSAALWIGPVFTACMAVFYMQWGKIMSNISTAIAMGLILQNVTRGLLLTRGSSARQYAVRRGFLAILSICIAEYALWTASCFWSGETFANPYYWLDLLLTISMFFLFIAVKGAEAG